MYKAIDLSTSREVAIKKMQLSEQPMERVIREIRLMREQDHQNVVTYLDSYLVEEEIWVSISFFYFQTTSFHPQSL